MSDHAHVTQVLIANTRSVDSDLHASTTAQSAILHAEPSLWQEKFADGDPGPSRSVRTSTLRREYVGLTNDGPIVYQKAPARGKALGSARVRFSDDAIPNEASTPPRAETPYDINDWDDAEDWNNADDWDNTND